MKLDKLKNKKILILGLAREGIDSLSFLRKIFPNKTLGLSDQLPVKNLSAQAREIIRKEKNIKLYSGKDYLKAIDKYDVILKTPGIPLRKISSFLNANQQVTSQTEIFLKNCQGIVIGITGTKGKSTTSSLINQILKTGGIKTHLIGNIGKPVLSYLLTQTKEQVYVYELSCHQLANIRTSPHIAVFLNLFREHLDYYKNFKEYIKAKSNICLHQKKTDYLVLNSKNRLVRTASEKSKSKKIFLYSEENGCFVKNDYIYSSVLRNKPLRIISTQQVPLLGSFNLCNVMAAISVAEILGIPKTKIAKAIKNFKSLPHRLEFVGTYKRIMFYNDSLSTIPQACIRAINVFKENVQTVLLGGFERKQNFEALSKKILASNIRNLILFPTTGERIFQTITRIGQKEEKTKKRLKQIKFFSVDNMEKAVSLCFQHTEKGKVCLLSPASPSFGIFKDYRDRGNLFKKYAKKYGEKK